MQSKIDHLFKKASKENTIDSKETYTLYFDGCSKGNPGIAGSGSVIYKNDIEIWGDSTFVGHKETNNMAEYMGLIIGLDQAIKMRISNLQVFGDSELVIKQMKGIYKVKSINMKTLHTKATELSRQIPEISYTHVYREYNVRADELSNIALQSVGFK